MNLTTFDFNEAPVRVMLRDEQPWFVAADVCRVLEIANSRDAIAALDEDERGVADADTLRSNVANTDIRIPNRGMQIISESGLYALVFKSRKPEAKVFRKWVTSEVLPAIRQTGRYEDGTLTPAATEPTRTVQDELARLRGLLLNSAEAVLNKALDVGRAQQVANLAARFLESTKLEGEAIGYERMLSLPAGAAGNGLLPPSGRPPAGAVQGLPQRGLPRTAAGEPGLPGEAVCGEAGLEPTPPGAGEPACATLHGTPAVGAGERGGACAAAGVPAGAVDAAGGDPNATTEGAAA